MDRDWLWVQIGSNPHISEMRAQDVDRQVTFWLEDARTEVLLRTERMVVVQRQAGLLYILLHFELVDG